MMLTNMDLGELIELAQETGGAEGNALKAELARRYREGDGVPPDPVEAEYWESRIEQVDLSTEAPPETAFEATADISLAKSEDPEAYYASLPERELYLAYREREPWAILAFSTHMTNNGDGAAALQELCLLSEELDCRYSSGASDAAFFRLIAETKRRCGQMYMDGIGTVVDMQTAQRFFEQAVEVGGREMIPALLRCYEQLGLFQTEQNTVLSLLEKLENGSAEERMLAAEAYGKLNRKTLEGIQYESIAQDKAAKPLLRANAIIHLVHLDRRTTEQTAVLARQGDVAASCAAVFLFAERKDFAAAEEMLSLCKVQDQSLVRSAKENLDAFRAFYATRAAAEVAEQERLRQEELNRLEEEAQSQKVLAENQRQEKRKRHELDRNTFLVCTLIGLALAFFSLLVSHNQLPVLSAISLFGIPFGWYAITVWLYRSDLVGESPGCLLRIIGWCIKLSISSIVGIFCFFYMLYKAFFAP